MEFVGWIADVAHSDDTWKSLQITAENYTLSKCCEYAGLLCMCLVLLLAYIIS